MITIHEVGIGHGARTLFRDASMTFAQGSRYGVVGANGSGKSTLLRVLIGSEEPNQGTVTIANNKTIGVLRQDHFAFEAVPILDVVMMGDAELWAALSEKDAMLKAAEADPQAFDVDRYGELEEVVLARDGYSLEARAAAILEGLNIPSAQHREPLSTLSGGYKLRALLAQTLAARPDGLLLDEPTNHLDIASIAWLERFLVEYPGLVVVVSHDHKFLNTTCTHIVDVDYERVTLYPGDYERFERAKASEMERLEADAERQEEKIAEHKDFVRRFRAKATKARQAQSRLKQLEKMEIVELPKSSRRYPRFRIEPERETGRQVLAIERVFKSFDEKRVLDDVSCEIMRGERVAIIGPNGIGKSTLLKIAVGELEPDAGSASWGYASEPGYFRQDHGAMRESGLTVHDWLWEHCPDQPIGFVRAKLAEVLFGKDDIDKPVSALSGGELARLDFARLSVRSPTVLVLDEPTNHLDIEGIEALANGLKLYPNAILFVSHDRWFVSELATRIIAISPEGVEDYRGSYEEFMRWSDSRDHLKR